jgi:hypothetical protein
MWDPDAGALMDMQGACRVDPACRDAHAAKGFARAAWMWLQNLGHCCLACRRRDMGWRGTSGMRERRLAKAGCDWIQAPTWGACGCMGGHATACTLQAASMQNAAACKKFCMHGPCSLHAGAGALEWTGNLAKILGAGALRDMQGACRVDAGCSHAHAGKAFDRGLCLGRAVVHGREVRDRVVFVDVWHLS